jgi:sulfur-oxidizing protein SoxY
MTTATVPESEHRPTPTRKTPRWCLLALCLTCVWSFAVAEGEGTADDETRWQAIRSALFGDRPIQDGDGLIALEAPYRALDAAVVPIGIQTGLEQTPGRYIRNLSLIIDNNPVPLAGVFHFPETSNWTALSTRVRVDSYTHIRAIAETSDGVLHMAANYVKASGGCSAPSSKDPAAAEAQLGRMKLRLPETVKAGEPLSMQILIKHPNSSGLQFDQVARSYIAPNYIQLIEVAYRDQPLFTLDSNISISEDPSIGMTFVPSAPGAVAVRAKDSNGRVFEDRFDVPAGH